MEIFELLIGLFSEFFLQILGDAFFELGIRGLAEVFETHSRRSPFLAFIGYAIWGCIIGALSLAVFPRHFVQPSRFHGISIIITPVTSGLIMGLWGRFLDNHGKSRIRLDSFAYGFIFA